MIEISAVKADGMDTVSRIVMSSFTKFKVASSAILCARRTVRSMHSVPRQLPWQRPPQQNRTQLGSRPLIAGS